MPSTTLLLPLFLFSLSLVTYAQQRSFAATKFELSPDLPAEEPVQVSPQSDGGAEHIPKPNHKHHATKPVKAVPTTPNGENPAGGAEQTSQSPSPTLVPLRTLAPVQGIQQPETVATPVPFNPFTLAPPFGQAQGVGQPQGQFVQPQPGQFVQPQQSQFVQPQQFATQPGQFVQQQGQFIQPQQGQFVQQQGQFVQPQPGQFVQQQGQFVQPQPGQFVTQPGQFQQVAQQPSQINQPDVQFSRAGAERVDLWFRENYDISICKRDSRFLANEFRLKFPKNLWKNGKETLLADLLAARLEDCFSKLESNHWKRVDGLISGLSLAATEEEECRSGLIQEQISCDNVFSYTCQFIQKAYNFRLVPTRLIIQEARFAEDGAEKCRKIVRKIKKELQQGKGGN